MAKKKDMGEFVQIRYVAERDSLKKFKKILRHFLQNEKRNIVADMTAAPEVPKDFLNSLVYSAKALQTLGYTITLMATPENYVLLKDSENASHFEFELVQVVSDSEISEMQEEASDSERESSFMVKNDTIIVGDAGIANISTHLGKLGRQILERNPHVILDLTRLSDISAATVQEIILHSLDFADVLKVQILPGMKKQFEENQQAAILDLEVVKKPVAEEITTEIAEFAIVPEPEEETFVMPQNPPEAEVQKADAPREKPGDERAKSKETLGVPFQREVNCLYVGAMKAAEFLREFPAHFSELAACGDQFYLDLSDYENLEREVAEHLLDCYLTAKKNGKNLVFRMLKSQCEKLVEHLPRIEEVTKRKVLHPSFEIVGGHLEIRDVDPRSFVEKFPQYFQKLLGTGHSELTVDISYLPELSSQMIELLVLCYLDAVGRGVSMMFRIRPEMEESFVKSGRGRSLPLEVIKPELKGESMLHHKAQGEAIDMGKIFAGMEDRLTDKVLKKEHDSVHIESRGSFQNWAPAPVKAEGKQVAYTGPERRRERRYAAKNLQVAFGKGSLGKIADRRYPLHNLSQSGACFTSSVQFSRAEPLRLKIYSEDNVGIEIAAKVVWCSPVPAQALFRVGVQFTKVSAIAKTQISVHLKKLHKQSSS